MSVSLSYAATLTATETLETNVDGVQASNRKIVHSAFDISGTANASTTPPVTTRAEKLIALTAGALTIDLTALTGWGTNGGTVNGTGLKVQFFRVKNLGANDMAFATGASNGYNFGGPVTLKPGGFILLCGNEGLPDVAAGAKNIDVTGTGTQTAQVTIDMG